jgi:D-glycero-D-manno-heptose 1,7-bisphosphate phosphatase
VRRAVFLDRDGTLIEDADYLGDPAGVRLLAGVPRALERLAGAGFALVVCSNQSGVARGLFGEDDVRAVNAAMLRALGPRGGPIALLLHCPHHPSAGAGPYTRPCECRKPAPGLVLRAARELGLDLAASWTIGDALRDLAAGVAAGIAPQRAVLVRTGKGRGEEARLALEIGSAARAVEDLAGAAELVLGAASTHGR